MFCTKCRVSSEKDAYYCSHCGALLRALETQKELNNPSKINMQTSGSAQTDQRVWGVEQVFPKSLLFLMIPVAVVILIIAFIFIGTIIVHAQTGGEMRPLYVYLAFVVAVFIGTGIRAREEMSFYYSKNYRPFQATFGDSQNSPAEVHVVSCPHCARENRIEAYYCIHCGTALADPDIEFKLHQSAEQASLSNQPKDTMRVSPLLGALLLCGLFWLVAYLSGKYQSNKTPYDIETISYLGFAIFITVVILFGYAKSLVRRLLGKPEQQMVLPDHMATYYQNFSSSYQYNRRGYRRHEIPARRSTIIGATVILVVFILLIVGTLILDRTGLLGSSGLSIIRSIAAVVMIGSFAFVVREIVVFLSN